MALSSNDKVFSSVDGKNRTLGYVPGTGTVDPFDALFNRSIMLSSADEDSVQKCDAVVLWGGEDIHPSLYGESAGSKMYVGAEPSRRDKLEWDILVLAKKHNKPVIGVCRGAQMLCAFAGGTLWQHTRNHGRSHPIRTKCGKHMVTSSVHHQMMRPGEAAHEILAYDATEQEVYDANDTLHLIPFAPEIVYFPDVKGLAIQGHPEFMNPKAEFVEHCLNLVQEKFL